MRTTLRDRSRAAGRRAHEIAAKLRTRSAAGRDEAQATVRRVTGQLAELAATAAEEAERLLANAKQALRRARVTADELRERGEHDAAAGRRRGRLARAVNDLTELLDATRQIVAQTRQRVAGHHSGRGDAAGQPARCGCPPDRQGPAGAPGRVRAEGPGRRQRRRDRARSFCGAGQSARRAATGPSRGAGEEASRACAAHRHRRPRLRRSQRRPAAHRPRCHERGDPAQRQTVPRRGAPKSIEKRSAAPSNGEPGSEGRISHLKRGYGWDRARIDGTEGARIWTGHGILAHNLVKISALAA